MDIEEFYEQDPRRQASDEIEFGRDWYEHDLRFEVAWVAETGEVYAMAEPNSRRGISTESVTVEILAVIEGSDAVNSVLTRMAGRDVAARESGVGACTRRRGRLGDVIRGACRSPHGLRPDQSASPSSTYSVERSVTHQGRWVAEGRSGDGSTGLFAADARRDPSGRVSDPLGGQDGTVADTEVTARELAVAAGRTVPRATPWRQLLVARVPLTGEGTTGRCKRCGRALPWFSDPIAFGPMGRFPVVRLERSTMESALLCLVCGPRSSAGRPFSRAEVLVAATELSRGARGAALASVAPAPGSGADDARRRRADRAGGSGARALSALRSREGGAAAPGRWRSARAADRLVGAALAHADAGRSPSETGDPARSREG